MSRYARPTNTLPQCLYFIWYVIFCFWLFWNSLLAPSSFFSFFMSFSSWMGALRRLLGENFFSLSLCLTWELGEKSLARRLAQRRKCLYCLLIFAFLLLLIRVLLSYFSDCTTVKQRKLINNLVYFRMFYFGLHSLPNYCF